jgi:hypothetical protein
MSTEIIVVKADEAVGRMQRFDVQSLRREADLGRKLSFSEAVDPAQELVILYMRIPLSSLRDFADTQLNNIIAQAQSDFNLFSQILNFEVSGDAEGTRANLIATVKVRRDQLFEQIWLFVAYGVARSNDAVLLETQGRAAIQTIRDESAILTAQLLTAKGEADAALTQIRTVAAEHGVSQQAIYFKDEYLEQERLAGIWLTHTYRAAAAVGVFALLSMFLHKFSWIRPSDVSESVQLVSSKIMIFAVLGFLLIMAARNYATHKHNSVVNRHRQNALLTYKALVAAAGEAGTEGIVLAHAAACIFSPQDTGFFGSNSDSQSGPKSVLEFLTKSAAKQ